MAKRKKAKAKKTTKTRTKKLAEATVSGNVYTARLGNGQSISAISLKTGNYLVAAYTSTGGAGEIALTLAEAKALGEALKGALGGNATIEIFKVKNEGTSGVKISETEAIEEPKSVAEALEKAGIKTDKKKSFFKRVFGG